MEANQLFNIKYLHHEPTHVETVFTSLDKRPRPLTTVSQLISATQHALPNQLGHLDINELSLHLTALSPQLPLEAVLSTLPTGTTLYIKSTRDVFIGISDFLSNTLEDIEKAFSKPSTTGTKRNHPKVPKHVGRWEEFLVDAERYDYPTTPIGKDVTLPATTEIKFKLERDVDKVIGNHLDNFNRIFEDQGINCRFASTADAFEIENQIENPLNFIGVPDNVLTLNSQVLSFIEDKTPNDLPLCHSVTGQKFDLLEMYQEDRDYQLSETTREEIGRTDVCCLIEQVYGYLSLNNLIYGCITCYEVTYFLWRPARGTLLITHPVYNNSSAPTLLQALYYFTTLVLKGHEEKQQTLEPSPKDTDMPKIVTDDTDTDTVTSIDGVSHEQSESGSNYSLEIKSKGRKYSLNFDSLRLGLLIGLGATGQVIRLKDSNIVVKHCDSYNNPDGFKMLKNEILVYEKLSKFNLNYVPRYYGECDFYGQHFIALEYIPGNHCDWRRNSELMNKLNFVIKELKSIGVCHKDLRPENVLLTQEGDIKLIDFGKADVIQAFN